MPSARPCSAGWTTARRDSSVCERLVSAIIATVADEAKKHAKDWDFLALAPALAGKAGLVITSKKDTDGSTEMVTTSFEAALKQAHAAQWTFRAFDDDHGFSAHRIEASREVIAWLDQKCGVARQQDCRCLVRSASGSRSSFQ